MDFKALTKSRVFQLGQISVFYMGKVTMAEKLVQREFLFKQLQGNIKIVSTEAITVFTPNFHMFRVLCDFGVKAIVI